jgi:hypothetical protein
MVHGYRILGIDEIFESLMPLALASGQDQQVHFYQFSYPLSVLIVATGSFLPS